MTITEADPTLTEKLTTALDAVAAAELHLTKSRTAVSDAQMAETAAARAIENPKATDDPAALIAAHKAADETLRHAILLAQVSDRRLQAAREAHIRAHHDTMRWEHDAWRDARIEAARKFDAAMATLADAEQANAAATAHIEKLYARGFPRPFDGARLQHRADIQVHVRTEAAETALWAGTAQ